MGKIAEQLEKIICCDGKDNYCLDHRECENLAIEIEKYILDAKPKEIDPVDFNRESDNPANPYNQALNQWTKNMETADEDKGTVGVGR